MVDLIYFFNLIYFFDLISFALSVLEQNCRFVITSVVVTLYSASA
jgi:hypothetical protein